MSEYDYNQSTRWLTRLIPSPSVPEKISKIWAIGSSHAINLSSPSRNILKAWACVRNMFETASGLSQVSSWAANGWVSRRFFGHPLVLGCSGIEYRRKVIVGGADCLISRGHRDNREETVMTKTGRGNGVHSRPLPRCDESSPALEGDREKECRRLGDIHFASAKQSTN